MVDLIINILTITLTIGVPHAVLSFVNNGNPFPDIYNQTIPSIITINETCTRTLYQSLCFTSFSSFPSSIRITSPERFLEFSINEIVKSLYSEFKTLLGAAMTNENTCIQGIEDVEEANPETYLGFKDVVQRLLNPVSKMIRNCLEMVKYMELTSGGEMIIAKQRPVSHGFPAWMTTNDRSEANTDYFVGHGNYYTISAAVRMAPSFSLQSYVIKIKAGVYNESVEKSPTFIYAFYKCNFASFQDTLYVHSLCQLYRECTIQGTVDFIFGNAAAIFQNCLILVRKPIAGQKKNMITAQGREEPNQSTGILLKNCTIKAAPDLMRASRSSYTFLGRPWRNHSRIIVMKSYLGDLLHPEGWYEWNQHSTLDTVERVTWGGYKRNCSEDLVEQFTVRKFLHGADNWLHSTSFPLSLGS
ncbi:hypothetical protein MKW92_044438 [Papaver armeniacum]|nr:hypothetical protein MKW92_044438 [Papaver armeniacum]